MALVRLLGRCLARNPAVRALVAREAVPVARRRREAVATLAAGGLEQVPGGGLRWIDGPVDVTYVGRGTLRRMRRSPSPVLMAAIERAAERRADR